MQDFWRELILRVFSHKRSIFANNLYFLQKGVWVCMSISFQSCRWSFMEMLGFIAFFGILLIHADSYRLELVMCILTVFSISAFVYILGDLDYAYHGCFIVDLGRFVDFLENLELIFQSLQISSKGSNFIQNDMTLETVNWWRLAWTLERQHCVTVILSVVVVRHNS